MFSYTFDFLNNQWTNNSGGILNPVPLIIFQISLKGAKAYDTINKANTSARK